MFIAVLTSRNCCLCAVLLIQDLYLWSIRCHGASPWYCLRR